MKTLKTRRVSFVTNLILATLLLLIALPAAIVMAQNESVTDPNSTEVKSGWHIQKTFVRDVIVTVQSVVQINPIYRFGSYYFIFSDYSTAHNGCDRIDLEMTILGTTLQGRPIKTQSGNVYWVVPFKMTDFPQWDFSLGPITVQVKYRVRMYQLKLVPGADSAFVQVTPKVQERFTKADSRFNFNDPAFQQYIGTCGFWKASNESDLDFAYRVYNTLISSIKFGGETKFYNSTSTINLQIMNCESSSVFFVSILRANKIPSRCISGYNVNTDNKLSEMCGHALVDIYINNIGWISCDPSLDIKNRPKDSSFGSFSGDTIPWYFYDSQLEKTDLGDGFFKEIGYGKTIQVYQNVSDQYGRVPNSLPFQTKDLLAVEILKK